MKMRKKKIKSDCRRSCYDEEDEEDNDDGDDKKEDDVDVDSTAVAVVLPRPDSSIEQVEHPAFYIYCGLCYAMLRFLYSIFMRYDAATKFACMMQRATVDGRFTTRHALSLTLFLTVGQSVNQ